jgi:large subunit ribosomal protein L23
MHWREIIRRPVVTEKSNMVAAQDQYTFEVDHRANKIQIKEAVELAWPDVTVSRVRIANMPSKRARGWRRRGMRVRKPGWKKAVVTLSSGRIELFEGVG